MFRKFVSHHKHAEAHIEAALESLDQAAHSATLAQEANGKAAASHETAIQFHSELLAEAHSRARRILDLVEKIHA